MAEQRTTKNVHGEVTVIKTEETEIGKVWLERTGDGCVTVEIMGRKSYQAEGSPLLRQTIANIRFDENGVPEINRITNAFEDPAYF
jgi:hypothetical protein